MLYLCILSLLVVVCTSVISPTQFDCVSGYEEYRSYYPVKEGYNMTSELERAFRNYCRSIKRKNIHSNYQVEYTILGDFPTEVINRLQEQSNIEYSGTGSEVDGIELVNSEYHYGMNGMDRVFDDDLAMEYSQPTGEHGGCSVSWASAIVKAGEMSLKELGIDVKLSWRYLVECVPKELQIENVCEGIRSKELIDFIREHGLVMEKNEEVDDICNVNENEVFRFEVKESEGPNKYGLMNLVNEGNPTIVLMAIDIEKVKFVKDMRNNEDVIRCGYHDPSLYGIVMGYKDSEGELDGYWEVETNVVPYENMFIRIPLTPNVTNANYGGIAAYSFSMKSTVIPREFVIDDSYGSIDMIPRWAEKITFKSNSFLNVNELVMNDFPHLRSLIFEDGSFLNVNAIELNLPVLEELIVGVGCFSGLNSGRRLSIGIGRFVLNCPNLNRIEVGSGSFGNIEVITIYSISVNIEIELEMDGMKNVNRIEYDISISIDIMTRIEMVIENSEGHEGDVVIVPLIPTTQPPTPTAQVPTTVAPTTSIPTTPIPTTAVPTLNLQPQLLLNLLHLHLLHH